MAPVSVCFCVRVCVCVCVIPRGKRHKRQQPEDVGVAEEGNSFLNVCCEFCHEELCSMKDSLV